jgi:hypothetical protein
MPGGREAAAVAINARIVSALICASVVGAVALICASVVGAVALIAQQANAQQGAGRGGGQGGRQGGAVAAADTRPFNAREIGGVWSRNSNGFGGGGTCADCGDRGYSLEWPEFTPAGQAAFDQNIPSYGREKGSADATAHPEEHIGRRRAQPPALGNDLYGQCNPMGIPRALLYPDPVEFYQLPDRVLQHFEWHYGLRTIWTDGRKLPTPVDLPRWWGYAVGRWEGDTFVVESTGYEDRTWIDYFGYPHSDVMHLEERYRRMSYDTLELNMTVTDPKFYAKPWKSQTKRFKLLPKDFIKTPEGWAGLLEDICAPVDELEFNRVIRDPAGTGKPAVPAPTRR